MQELIDRSSCSWHHWRWHIRLLRGQEFVLVRDLVWFSLVLNCFSSRCRFMFGSKSQHWWFFITPELSLKWFVIVLHHEISLNNSFTVCVCDVYMWECYRAVQGMCDVHVAAHKVINLLLHSYRLFFLSTQIACFILSEGFFFKFLDKCLLITMMSLTYNNPVN